MEEYTKGDWKVELNRVWGYNINVNGKVIVSVHHLQGENQQGFANAHLIAASPRMVEFIQKLASEGNKEASAFIQTLDLL